MLRWLAGRAILVCFPASHPSQLFLKQFSFLWNPSTGSSNSFSAWGEKRSFVIVLDDEDQHPSPRQFSSETHSTAAMLPRASPTLFLWFSIFGQKLMQQQAATAECKNTTQLSSFIIIRTTTFVLTSRRREIMHQARILAHYSTLDKDLWIYYNEKKKKFEHYFLILVFAAKDLWHQVHCGW